MRRSRFSEEQIAHALRQAEHGTSVTELCRKLGVSEVRRVKQLEEENGRLKRLVADLSLDKEMLQELLKGKW